MLPQKYHLTTQDFKRVGSIRPTRTVKGQYCTIKIFPATKTISRFAVVVGKSVDKRAVVRNRIKRTIYDFFREHLDKFAVAEYVCIVHASAAKATKEILLTSLDAMLGNSNT